MRDPVEDFALEDRIQAPFEHPDLAGFVDDRVTPIEVANQLLERLLAAGDLGRDIGCGDGLIEFGGLAAHLPAGSGFAPHPGDFGAKVTAPDVYRANAAGICADDPLDCPVVEIEFDQLVDDREECPRAIGGAGVLQPVDNPFGQAPEDTTQLLGVMGMIAPLSVGLAAPSLAAGRKCRLELFDRIPAYDRR